MRNTSKDGPFAPFDGMRIPSRPYLFASWGGRLRSPDFYGFLEQVSHDAGIT